MGYNVSQIGCYADGAYGSDHARKVLIQLLRDNEAAIKRGANCYPSEFNETIDALMGPSSDDFYEENNAIEMLNTQCDSCHFEFDAGDLLLLRNEEES